MGTGTDFSDKLQINKKALDKLLAIDTNFDVLYKDLVIGEREAGFYFIDGFVKDEVMQKLMSSLEGVTKEKMPSTVEEFSKQWISYVEVDIEANRENLIRSLLSGVVCMFIDGYNKALAIDCRTYPARGVDEPDKDRVMRGSRDGFVETVVFNTALIRRRIRNPQLRMEMLSVGRSSKTDVVISYMDDRADKAFLENLRKRIQEIDIDALSMNQESLAECLYKRSWFNPFPKYKYSERPDTAAASILEGNIVILVDNSPSAMILPTSVFDIIEEADDYYFPPVTGTYLRLSRFLTTLLTWILTPTWLLFMRNPNWIPEWLEFIVPAEEVQVPLIFQLLILEFAIDGLRLAAINTPNMLSTPLSVIAGLVLGDYAVQSGWFNAESMLYMAFVVLANYSQPSFELGFALKFMRLIMLVLTSVFSIYGYVAGAIISICAVVFNKTISGKSYLYPVIPFNKKDFIRRFIRISLPKTEE
ncbi:MAG: spore germination protein [Lachnospiraceae bacterium]|nr:spore germination protein [Lachnospiraceae bacterium]